MEPRTEFLWLAGKNKMPQAIGIKLFPPVNLYKEHGAFFLYLISV